jgi:hypothetical protein
MSEKTRHCGDDSGTEMDSTSHHGNILAGPVDMVRGLSPPKADGPWIVKGYMSRAAGPVGEMSRCISHHRHGTMTGGGRVPGTGPAGMRIVVSNMQT